MRRVLLSARPVPRSARIMAALVLERRTAMGPAITENLLTKPISPH